MHPIADNFRHNMRTVRHSSHNTRLTMRKCRHGIIKMHRMTGSCVKSLFSGIIICIGVSEGYGNFPFYFPDKSFCLRFFRRHSDKFYQTPGSLLEPFINFRTAWKDVSFILSSFFNFTDKRSFHIDPYQIGACHSGSVFLTFFVFCGIGKNGFQFLHRKRHGRRRNRRYPDRRLIGGDRIQSFLCAVTDIHSFTAMKMQINHPRQTVAAFSIYRLCFRFFYGSSWEDFFNPVSICYNITGYKLLIRHVDFYIFYDHVITFFYLILNILPVL